MGEPQNLEITLGENLQTRHWLRGLITDLSEHHFAIVAVAFVVVCLFCCWFFFYRKKKNRNLEKIYNYTIFFLASRARFHHSYITGQNERQFGRRGTGCVSARISRGNARKLRYSFLRMLSL